MIGVFGWLSLVVGVLLVPGWFACRLIAVLTIPVFMRGAIRNAAISYVLVLAVHCSVVPMSGWLII